MVKPQPASQKKQQDLLNFFTPKSSIPRTVPVPQSQLSPTLPSLAEDHSLGNIYDSESEDETEPLQALTNGASKHILADDTYEDGNGAREPPSKRAKSDNGERSTFFAETAPGKSKVGAISKSVTSPRTQRYMYSGSSQAPSSAPIPEEEEEEENESVKAQKEALHKKFVKKLGHPDSIAQIRRRLWQSTEEMPVVEDGDGEGEEGEDGTPPPSKTRKKGAKTGKLTPLELQVLDIKRKHMDTLLIVEVGYKFKFFGEDARTAAKELSIVCIPGKFRYDEHPSEAHLDRFASASIPVHRLPVHAKRLVSAGHKVGVVRQIETAALKKAGDNRNAPFVRKLTNVYTKGTYIDDIDGLNQPTDAPSGGAPATGYLLCITESKAKGGGTDEKVDVGVLAVQPATGDIIYDTFEDGFMRSEIETRLLHIAPCEFLIVGELTKATEKLVQYLSGSSTNVFGDRIRVERVPKSKTMAVEAHSHVTQFYADKLKRVDESAKDREQNLLEKVLKLSEHVTICLSAMITHLTEYGLHHVFDLTKYFQSFSARSHMLLQGNTLQSLEIYQNQTDYTEKGSLFWTIDKTQTRFGQRLLRKWVGQPLLDIGRLEERVAAVEELKDGHHTPSVDKLRALLRNIKSDIERSLIRIYYGKCSRPELLTALQTLQKISNEYAGIRTHSDAGFHSTLISHALASLPTINSAIVPFLSRMNGDAARKDDKYAFFHESAETEAISNHKLGIAAVEADLEAHRTEASTVLKQKQPVVYVTVSAIEYLIEVPNTALKHVPASWAKISGTKKVSRFHTPPVVAMLRERDQHKESLSAACDAAFAAFLAEIAEHYALLRDAIAHLATLDCLLSLATVAALPGYCKPTFVDSTEISITDGRHPMIEQLLPTAYIPNSTALSTSSSTTTSPTPLPPSHSPPPSPRALLITGPNMGGKSSYIRSIALLCILAQIGSYVPARAARLGLLDGIFVRMGARDSLFTGQSTFMVEVSETASILQSATPRSLVILDELGRGTSTHDGVAIAGAVLEYVVREVGCLCLFVTHYQALQGVARGFEEEGRRGAALKNVHMRFVAERKAGGGGSGGGLETKKGEATWDGDEEITFLYEVGEGVAHRSYGLNVARLAKVPSSVLETAARKSCELEMHVKRKTIVSLSKMMGEILRSGADEQLEQLIAGIEQL